MVCLQVKLQPEDKNARKDVCFSLESRSTVTLAAAALGTSTRVLLCRLSQADSRSKAQQQLPSFKQGLGSAWDPQLAGVKVLCC